MSKVVQSCILTGGALCSRFARYLAAHIAKLEAVQVAIRHPADSGLDRPDRPALA